MSEDDLTRGEDVFVVDIGTTFVSEIGDLYVFMGWRRNTAGSEMMFIKSYDPVPGVSPIRGRHLSEPYTYHASLAHTLLRKFPGLKDHRR